MMIQDLLDILEKIEEYVFSMRDTVLDGKGEISPKQLWENFRDIFTEVSNLVSNALVDIPYDEMMPRTAKRLRKLIAQIGRKATQSITLINNYANKDDAMLICLTANYWSIFDKARNHNV